MIGGVNYNYVKQESYKKEKPFCLEVPAQDRGT
jgi:hypothetical protein